jgi:hypothetical protein
MFKKSSNPSTNLALLLITILAGALSLGAAQGHTLILNGDSTDVLIIFVNGHPYVDLEALANALKGSVSSSGAMVALSLPVGAPNRAPSSATASAAPAPPPGPAPMQATPSNPGFSREFLNAGIEQMSTLREWHTALQTAIQNGIPLSEGLLQPYRARATSNLRLANVAVTTAADRNAYQLLNNVYLNMGKLSDKYVNMRANMTYIAPDALENDDLNQRIMSCGRFLGAMAASGLFSDVGSCH